MTYGNKEQEQQIAHIQSLIHKDFQKVVACDRGWDEIIIKCHEELTALDPNYIPVQIKQKFGGLRYYFDTDTEPLIRAKMYEITNKYEQMSFTICEVTGGKGELMKHDGQLFVVDPELADPEWEFVEDDNDDLF